MKSGVEHSNFLEGGSGAVRRCGVGLGRVVETSAELCQVERADLKAGDWVLVKTVNSVYRIRVVGAEWYEASGGWFDRQGRSPMIVRIAGCSWGGSIIKTGIVAACGLFLEFGNRLVTTPIQKIIVLRSFSAN